MTQQFDMSLLIPGMTYEDTENMTTVERVFMYEKLAEYVKKKYGKK